MTWEWVTLILGIVALIIAFGCYLAWTQMRVRMFELLPPPSLEMPEMITEIKEPGKNG